MSPLSKTSVTRQNLGEASREKIKMCQKCKSKRHLNTPKNLQTVRLNNVDQKDNRSYRYKSKIKGRGLKYWVFYQT